MCPYLTIQQCIREVDPINTAMRWAVPTYRRQYQVPHPNYIWHLDGNHKLIRYKREFVCTFHVITLSLSLSLSPSPPLPPFSLYICTLMM